FKMHLGFSILSVILFKEFIPLEVIGIFNLKILLVEQVEDFLRLELPTLGVTGSLYDCAEFRVHGCGKMIAEALGHDESRATLAALAVNADNGLILTAHICRVDGQIGNLPILGSALGHIFHTFVDSVLMGTGESGKYQFAGIGMPLVNLH